MENLAKFRELGLSDRMIEALSKKGFEEPTPIQALTIPFLLSSDKDVVGQAQTGTGKTGAFGIPLVERVTANSGKVKAIIMAPTRELAVQVTEEMSSLSPDRRLKIISIYGGQPIDRQIDRLRRGVDIVVGTPGRIMDHLKRGTLDISEVEYVVLDEADEMLNMGFIDDIETILKSTPENKKMLLFSATMPRNILNLAKTYMRDFEIVSVKKDELTQGNVEQIYFEVSQSDKFEALYRIIDVEEAFYGVVFCRTKVDVDDVVTKLNNRGLRAAALHGDVSQAQREKILRQFKSKSITVLVATDVAARGIDVNDLTHVINHSLPQDPESYVHRIGRTGRAGKTGVAITLVTPSEYRKLSAIKRVTNSDIARKPIPNVKKVVDAKKGRIKESINSIIEEENYKDLEDMASEILQENDPKTALAALLKHAFKDELNERNYREIADRSSRGNDGGDRSYVDRKGTARLFVARGKNDGMNPRSLVEMIEKETGVQSSRIDDVRILDDFSFIAASFEDAETIIRSFQNLSDGGRSLVSRAKEKSSDRRDGGRREGGGRRDGGRNDRRGGDRGDRGGFKGNKRRY